MEQLLSLDTYSLILVLLSAFLIGASKAGIKGVGLLIVPLMASVFGAKPSTGIVLPMLILADLMAVVYYRRNVNWFYIRRLVPWAFIGILVGVIVGDIINGAQFRWMLGGIIIVMLLLLIIKDIQKTKLVPKSKLFAPIMGLAGGFVTMVGNAAGPVFSIYLLSMRLPKRDFIGTGACFFLLINLTKVPFHIFSWETIDSRTIIIDFVLFPIIAAGMYVGINLVKLFSEKVYRYFVIGMTSLAALFMLVA